MTARWVWTGWRLARSLILHDWACAERDSLMSPGQLGIARVTSAGRGWAAAIGLQRGVQRWNEAESCLHGPALTEDDLHLVRGRVALPGRLHCRRGGHAALSRHDQAAVLGWASTNVHNLRHHPVGSLVASAFVTQTFATAWPTLIARGHIAAAWSLALAAAGSAPGPDTLEAQGQGLGLRAHPERALIRAVGGGCGRADGRRPRIRGWTPARCSGGWRSTGLTSLAGTPSPSPRPARLPSPWRTPGR